MARRSERVKTKHQSTGCESPPEDMAESPDEDYAAKKPQRKKQRLLGTSHGLAGGRKVRGKQGLLKELPEMPLDILFEIFSQVEPGDLMQLARATKALRAILMNRSAMSIWKAARSNLVGLPPCPDDMTEPQYAVMLFDPYCHYCSGKARDFAWQLRIRCCQQCSSERFVPRTQIPYSRHVSVAELVQMLPFYMKKWTIKRTTRSQIEFHLETIELWQVELAHCNSDEERADWVRKKAAIARERCEHGNACCRWLEEQEVNRIVQLDDIRLRRKEEIVSRLANMGWKEEIDMMLDENELFRHPQVWQRKGLTERAWNNMKQSLIDLMEKCKSVRLVKEYKVILARRLPVMDEVRNSFTQTCAPDAIIPSVADMCFFEPFRTVFQDLSHSEEVGVDTLATAIAQLPELIHAWTEQTQQELLKMIPTFGESKNDSSKLLLATTYFECNGCQQCEPIVYPRVLIHSGATTFCSQALDVHLGPYGLAATEILCQTPWNSCGQIKFHLEAHRVAVTVLKVCGFDPETTTAQQMDEAQSVLECLHCQDDWEGRLFMTWRGAVAHACLHACKAVPVHASTDLWALASGETQIKAKFKLDEELMLAWSRRHSEDLFCVHCRQKGNYFDLKSHLRSHHPELDQSKSSMHPVLDAKNFAEPIRLLTEGYRA